MKTRSRWAVAVIVGVLAVAAAAMSPAALSYLRKAPVQIPTARVTRGPLELSVYTSGELRASRTAMLSAPSVGGVLQIAHMAQPGTRVNPGDVVVEFDPSEQEFNLEQARSELEEAEQELKKMKADAAVRVAQDKVALLRAQFDVRRAELTVKGNDLLPGIEARKNVLNLEEAKRRLQQLQQELASRASSDVADTAVQEQKRARATIAMRMAQQNIENMRLRAPIAGIVAIAQNMDASGGIMFTGMELPEYREGDQTSPGRLIAQVLDIAQMEILSKVAETDRGTLESGQSIEARVDSLPLQPFRGKVRSLAGMAASSSIFTGYGAVRTFDASFDIASGGTELRSGCTAQIKIRGGTLQDALSVPRQALFQREGKPTLYVKRADTWDPETVQVKHLTESRLVLEGLREGTEVALVDPEAEKEKSGAKSGVLSSILGGILR